MRPLEVIAPGIGDTSCSCTSTLDSCGLLLGPALARVDLLVHWDGSNVLFFMGCSGRSSGNIRYTISLGADDRDGDSSSLQLSVIIGDGDLGHHPLGLG